MLDVWGHCRLRVARIKRLLERHLDELAVVMRVASVFAMARPCLMLSLALKLSLSLVTEAV